MVEIDKIKAQMKYHKFDWNNEDLDKAMDKRQSGGVFTWSDHLEALLLSLLSANRPWYQIANSKDSLRKIFFDYDKDQLYLADPESLADTVCSIGCGNRRIYTQMRELKNNILVLRSIERNYGDVDALAQMAVDNQLEVMTMLSYKGGMYKLKGVGKALALEYLRRLGVDAVKPDVHIRRILQRFGYFPYLPSEVETFELIREASGEHNIPMHEIGSLLWSFCATGYMQICEATPHCDMCYVQCKSSTCDESAVGHLATLVKWSNYLDQFDEPLEEIRRLTELYKTYDTESIVRKLGL